LRKFGESGTLIPLEGATVAAASPAPSLAGTPLEDGLLQDAAATFGILAATARLQIVWLLADAERDVSTLAREIGQSISAVSQHLAKLKLAGLVRVRRDGRRSIYIVDDPHLVDIVQLAVSHHDELHAQRTDQYPAATRKA
jgi:DNA-binding transcriptional ArsR family regulator